MLAKWKWNVVLSTFFCETVLGAPETTKCLKHALVLDRRSFWTHAWWRHQMETFTVLLDLCEGNSPVSVKSLHKGQWRGALMFSVICAWINNWVNNREAGDLRRHRGLYDVNVMDLAEGSPEHLSITSVREYCWHNINNVEKHICYKQPSYICASSIDGWKVLFFIDMH